MCEMCDVDGDGERHYKGFIFGSKTADAKVRANVYRECEQLMQTISDGDASPCLSSSHSF